MEPREPGTDAMTSSQTMLRVIGVLTGVVLGGCAVGERLVAPKPTIAPYDSVRGEVLWGVVPLRNESGTSAVDRLAVSDAVVQAAEEVRGVTCVPLNRTLGAMKAIGMVEPESPADLSRLAQAMGVDGLIVGSVTAYDPYDPPTMGLALALYQRPGQASARGLDARELVYQPTDYEYFARSAHDGAPASVVSEMLDASGHDVQLRVKQYTTGRGAGESSLGWRRTMASMDLYTAFVAWHTVDRLVDHEWIRLAAGPGEARE